MRECGGNLISEASSNESSDIFGGTCARYNKPVLSDTSEVAVCLCAIRVVSRCSCEDSQSKTQGHVVEVEMNRALQVLYGFRMGLEE
jgi:hypothetical protein